MSWSPREDREDRRDRGSRDGYKRQDKYVDERRGRESRDDYEESRRSSRDDYVRSSKRPREDSEHSSTSKHSRHSRTSPKRRPTADEFFDQRTPSLKQTTANKIFQNATWISPNLRNREASSLQNRGTTRDHKSSSYQAEGNKTHSPPAPLPRAPERRSLPIHPDRQKLQPKVSGKSFSTSTYADHVDAHIKMQREAQEQGSINKGNDEQATATGMLLILQ